MAEYAAAAVAVASLITSGVATYRSSATQRTAGKIAQRESETEAKQIELAAVQRETDRKAKLSRALATQIASIGVRGISAFEGSPLTILQADIEAEQTATERDKFQTRLAAMTTRTQGFVQKELSKAGAGMSLLSGASSIGLQSAQFSQTAKAKD